MPDRDRSSSPPEVILAAAIATLARSADPDETVAELLAALTAAVGAERAAVVVWDAERGSLALAASVGYKPDAAAALGATVAADADHPLARTAHGQSAILGTEAAGAGEAPMVPATWPLRIAGPRPDTVPDRFRAGTAPS